MTFGLDENKRRVRATPDGKAWCPLCGELLTSKCGNIKRHHWSHSNQRDCDPWTEPETEWHREWKNKFPERWQETIITNSEGVKHIADIKTSYGAVIEFQNSFISSQTISEREQFYKEMVWVINAKPFFENLKLRERTQVELSKFFNDQSNDYTKIHASFNTKQSELQTKIEGCKISINNLSRPLYLLRNNVKNLKSHIAELQDPNAAALPNLNKKYQLYNSVFKYHHFLPGDWFTSIYSKETSLEELNVKLQKKEAILARMQTFPEIEIDGQAMRIIPINTIHNGNYQNVVLISKKEATQFFKRKVKLKSLLDLPHLKTRAEEFHFCMDLTSAFSLTISEIKNLRKEFELLQKSALEEYLTLKEKILDHLRERLKIDSSQLDEKDNLLKEYKRQQEVLSSQFNHNEDHRKEIIDEMISKLNHDKQKKRIESIYIDQYVFEWHHERKSWRAATAPIYFDFQDGTHLYELLGENLLRKFLIKDFIYSHNPDLET
jgi:hypothetical protein